MKVIRHKSVLWLIKDIQKTLHDNPGHYLTIADDASSRSFGFMAYTNDPTFNDAFHFVILISAWKASLLQEKLPKCLASAIRSGASSSGARVDLTDKIKASTR